MSRIEAISTPFVQGVSADGELVIQVNSTKEGTSPACLIDKVEEGGERLLRCSLVAEAVSQGCRSLAALTTSLEVSY